MSFARSAVAAAAADDDDLRAVACWCERTSCSTLGSTIDDGDTGDEPVASTRGADVGVGFLRCREDSENEERDDRDDEDGEFRLGELMDNDETSGRRENVDDCRGLSLDDWMDG